MEVTSAAAFQIAQLLSYQIESLHATMKLKNELERQITIKYRRLQKRKEQAALYGPSVEPHILIEIEDLEAEIEALEEQLTQITVENNSPVTTTGSAKVPQTDVQPNTQTSPKRLKQYLIRGLVGLGGVGVVIFGLILVFSMSVPPECRTASLEPGHIRVLVSHNEGDHIRWWVGQDGQGLRTFTCLITSCAEANFSPAQTFLASEQVLDVAWEETDSSPEEIWVITAQGRLARLNKQGDQWSQAELLQQKYCPASALIARAEDLYLGPSDANQAQLYIFDKQQQWATSQPLKFPEESRLQVKDLTLDKATQALWVGTTVGLYWVSNNQSSSSIYPASDTTEYLWVEALAMDDEDTLWIGTGNQGLFRFNPVTNKWSQLNGLPSKRITSISLSASNKTALVGTDNGLGVCQWNNESVYHCSNVDNLNIQHEVDAISLTPDGVSMIGTSDQLVVINDLITLAK